MRTTAQVVIIGGGIQGVSLAYYLARRGLTDVVLLEMEMLGSGSSGQSASVIGHAFQNEQCLPLTRLSYDLLMDFAEETGTSPDFEPIGCLALAGPAADWMRDRHALLQQLGVSSELLDADGILQLTPGLNLEGIEVGLYVPGDGGLDAHMIISGCAGRARQLGVQIVEGVRAVGLEMRGGRVAGVRTTAGLIAADCVVNAAGARAREAAGWAGMDLPITNIKRHIVVTGPVAAYPRPIPFTYEWEKPWYIRREGPGLLMGMGSKPTVAGDLAVEADVVEQIIDYAIYRAPALEEAGLMTAWAGLRPVTPDDSPIMGEAAHLRGFINDCGWGGHGVMHALGAGLSLAELVADGRATLLDLAPFRAERFAGVS